VARHFPVGHHHGLRPGRVRGTHGIVGRHGVRLQLVTVVGLENKFVHMELMIYGFQEDQ